MIKKLFKKIFNDNPNNFNEISFKQGFDLTELPICTFEQRDEKSKKINRFNFLLDTGSNSSIIDSNILNQIKYTPIKKKSNLFGLEGQKVVVKMCDITLSYKNKDYKYEYLIKDMKEAFTQIKQESGVTLHGLLGSKFFNEFKYVLDFDELIAYSKA